MTGHQKLGGGFAALGRQFAGMIESHAGGTGRSAARRALRDNLSLAQSFLGAIDMC